MQHRTLLELVENNISSMNLDRLRTARLLLQSDLYSANCRIYDLRDSEPDRIADLEAERDRIQKAIGEINHRIEA